MLTELPTSHSSPSFFRWYFFVYLFIFVPTIVIPCPSMFVFHLQPLFPRQGPAVAHIVIWNALLLPRVKINT